MQSNFGGALLMLIRTFTYNCVNDYDEHAAKTGLQEVAEREGYTIQSYDLTEQPLSGKEGFYRLFRLHARAILK